MLFLSPTDMVGGRLRCPIYFFSALPLLWVCLINVEASSCEHDIHKKVGDTVVFSSCLPTEGVTSAIWKYRTGGVDRHVAKTDQFKDRYDEDSKNYTLTVRQLTRQDSGDFSFVSEVNDQQRKTVKITLHVHEPITQQPGVKVKNLTLNALNGSCTISLECNSDSNVTYKWTVGSQTQTGPKLQYTFWPDDGDTTFTCTVSNVISEQSAVIMKMCSNNTMNTEAADWVLVASAAGGGCAVIVIIVVVVCLCKKKNAAPDTEDLTLYADICDVTPQDKTSSMKPTSVYETIDNRRGHVTPGPQTVYDKIQLTRMRKASVSPYQEVS